jgi:hypothetical protein
VTCEEGGDPPCWAHLLDEDDDADRAWCFQRAVARVEAAVEAIVADFATSYVGRPVRRRDTLPPRPRPGIAWSIDGDLVVEFVHRDSAPDQLLVHDVALLDSLKRRFRTRHVEVAHVATTWDS